MPKIIIEKPSLPTLWVDTAVGIKLAKVDTGEGIQELERRRMVKLKGLVIKNARNCKLLCPESDQDWEYYGGRLDGKISEAFAALSRGIQTLPRQTVHDSQTFIAMAAYINRDQEFRLPSSIYFDTDPIQKLHEISQQQFFVSASGLPPMLLEMIADSREKTCRYLEEPRRKNIAIHKTYTEQFVLEQASFPIEMVEFAKSFRGKLARGNVTPEECLAAQGYEGYFRRWYGLTNKHADWDGICAFFRSEYYCELPVTKISSQLHAKLVTDDTPIEYGDSMDVQHLSLAIPLAHFVLTDRKMANRIEAMGIDKEWNAQVFSESTIDNLFGELEKL